MAGAAGNRIRRVNFLDLAAATLDSCRARIDEALPGVRQLQEAIDEHRRLLAAQIAGEMRAELVASRRPWESRLLAKTTSRWGLSPFALVLRVYQGIGGLLAGAMLYRARTPAQMALWGALGGMHSWRKSRQAKEDDRGLGRIAAGGFSAAELRKAAIIVEGYVSEAGLDRGAAQWNTVQSESQAAAADFVARASSDLETLVAELAKRRAGWFTRGCYELLLLAMLGAALFRLGKNFFYDSWLAEHPPPSSGWSSICRRGSGSSCGACCCFGHSAAGCGAACAPARPTCRGLAKLFVHRRHLCARGSRLPPRGTVPPRACGNPAGGERFAAGTGAQWAVGGR